MGLVKMCRHCLGTGIKLKSAAPVTWKKCNRCGGSGGKRTTADGKGGA